MALGSHLVKALNPGGGSHRWTRFFLFSTHLTFIETRGWEPSLDKIFFIYCTEGPNTSIVRLEKATSIIFIIVIIILAIKGRMICTLRSCVAIIQRAVPSSCRNICKGRGLYAHHHHCRFCQRFFGEAWYWSPS